MAGPIRTFESGATRDNAEGKPDYPGFESALVSKRFAEYMDKNRTQPDGSVRGSDNWKKGIPQSEYLLSLARHMKDLELHAEGFPAEAREDRESALCAIIFNARGLLFEILKDKYKDKYNGKNAVGLSSNVYGPIASRPKGILYEANLNPTPTTGPPFTPSSTSPWNDKDNNYDPTNRY